jgi:hypothetical protein
LRRLRRGGRAEKHQTENCAGEPHHDLQKE